MLLSEILAELQTIYASHGDLPVTIKIMDQGGAYEIQLSKHEYKSLMRVERRPVNIWGLVIEKRLLIDKT